jgi:cytochrome c oxidase assembly protein subunit 15
LDQLSGISLPARLRKRTNDYTVTPAQYTVIAGVALGAMVLIVLTGEAVRLTGSGLGCPTWPRCYGHVYPPLSSHAVIEFSNRVLSVPVCVAAILAWVAALRRRPYRRDLAQISLLLPLGVVAQAILGGLTVLGKLDYGWVMAHFALSMLVILGASTLMWRTLHPVGERPRNADRLLLRMSRGVFALTALVVFAGTAATAAAPDAGGAPHEPINRLDFDGHRTLDFVIHRHAELAAVLGVVALLLWWIAHRRSKDPVLRQSSAALCVAIAMQGVVGLAQYYAKLPAGLVWLHVVLACIIWITAIWACFAAGRPVLATASATDQRPGGQTSASRGQTSALGHRSASLADRPAPLADKPSSRPASLPRSTTL